jgi:hypothetical protein
VTGVTGVVWVWFNGELYCDRCDGFSAGTGSMASLAWLNRVAGGSLRGPLRVGPAMGVGQMGGGSQEAGPDKDQLQMSSVGGLHWR